MTTLTIRTEVNDDGTLRLEVPCSLPPGPVDVVLVVQPAPGTSAPDRRARSGLFLGRGGRNVDPDAATDEMNAAWKAKLADLAP